MKDILDSGFAHDIHKNKRSLWHIIVLFLLIIGSIVSTLIAWVEIESIIGSGPIMSIIGIVFLIQNILNKEGLGMIIGAMVPAISLAWFIIIYLYSLGPSDCELIVPASLTVASTFVVVGGSRLYSPKNNDLTRREI
ncbi:MAG: hypothetical protein MK212_09985 [Saprospiraceae bacterium]|nr:hypothetical protein [Saprospiraceae bacterium]